MVTREKKARQLNLRVTQTTYSAVDTQRGALSQADYVTALVLRDGSKTKPIEAVDPLLWLAIIQGVGSDGAARVGAAWAALVGGGES